MLELAVQDGSLKFKYTNPIDLGDSEALSGPAMYVSNLQIVGLFHTSTDFCLFIYEQRQKRTVTTAEAES